MKLQNVFLAKLKGWIEQKILDFERCKATPAEMLALQEAVNDCCFLMSGLTPPERREQKQNYEAAQTLE